MDAHHQFDGMTPHKWPKNEEGTPTESKVDRISDLPEGVIHHLLSLLPAHDAVRTCVLAQRWRHLWRSVPAIRFTTVDGFRSADRFYQFVDRVLLQRRHGAPLESCDFLLVQTEVYSHGFLLDPSKQHVSHWIWRALRRQVRVLTFSLRFDEFIWLPDLPLFSQHLTRLELEGVCASESVLDFSGCPTLVDLQMVECVTLSETMSSLSLKHLRMIGCLDYSTQRTRISLPNLVTLELDNRNAWTPLFERMPSLVTAIIRIGYESSARCKKGGSGDCVDDPCEGCQYYYCSEDGHRRCLFLRGLSQATHLELSTSPDVFILKRGLKWCPAFSKLKTLVLDEWFVTDDLSALIWFLQNSPILEKLTLQISKEHKISAGAEGRYSPFEQSVVSDHLELVEIKCREVDEMVVAILKILSVSGIPLEKIQIHKSS